MAWIHLTQNCQVVGLEGNVLTLGFANAGARDSFISSGCAEVVHQAAIDVVGADWKIETIVDPGAQPEGTPTITKAAADPARRPRARGRHRRSRRRRRRPTGPADDEPAPSPSRPGPSARHGRGPRGDPADPGGRAPRRRGPTTWPPPTRWSAATTSTRTLRGSAARTCSPASSARP